MPIDNIEKARLARLKKSILANKNASLSPTAGTVGEYSPSRGTVGNYDFARESEGIDNSLGKTNTVIGDKGGKVNIVTDPDIEEYDERYDPGGASAAQYASLAIPAYAMADNAARIKKLSEDGLEINPKSFDPILPAVTSLQRPNFTNSSRPGRGSSLAETGAEKAFSLAQNKEREQQFNIANDQFINEQERGNAEFANRAESFNVAGRNRVQEVNLQNRLNRLGQLDAGKDSALTGLLHNLGNFANQDVEAKAFADAAGRAQDVRDGKAGIKSFRPREKRKGFLGLGKRR
jgi:hypothetical protein